MGTAITIFFLIDVIPSVDKKHYKFPNLNLVRVLVIFYACSVIHLGPYRVSFSNLSGLVWRGENIENDTNTIVWTKNIILSVFEVKTPFSNLSGLVWTGL